MIDHEGLIKEARAWFATVRNPLESERMIYRLADALEARVLSPSEGDLGSLGPKEALHAAAEGECEPSGHRWPKRGDRMRFLGKNGYEFELKVALEAFTVGQELVVASCDVGSWSHSVTFDGQPGSWNGVMFELMPPEAGSRHPVQRDGEAISEGDVATEHNPPPNIPTAETGPPSPSVFP